MAWKAKIKIKDLLTEEDVPPDKAEELAHAIVRRLKNGLAFSPPCRRHLIDCFEGVMDQEMFNDAMDELYDAGDEERVWVE